MALPFGHILCGLLGHSRDRHRARQLPSGDLVSICVRCGAKLEKHHIRGWIVSED